MIKRNEMNVFQAHKRFQIPYATLTRHLKQKDSKKSAGRPQLVSDEIERMIADFMRVVADWGYPIGRDKLKLLVKSILDDQLNAPHPVFKNNTPGPKWIRNFINRNKLSRRKAGNIPRSRASISVEDVEQFFDNYKQSLVKIFGFIEAVKSEQLRNYDETNLQNDPGREDILVPRGHGWVERVQDHSKSAALIVFCCWGFSATNRCAKGPKSLWRMDRVDSRGPCCWTCHNIQSNSKWMIRLQQLFYLV